MASNFTALPVLSPGQREHIHMVLSPPPWKPAELPLIQQPRSWSVAHHIPTGCESSCSTAASEVSSESGTEKEGPERAGARDVCSGDVEWLLAALGTEQEVHFGRSLFRRECARIFRIMDKDDSGYLDPSELELVIEHLIPQRHKAISCGNDQRLMLSVKSLLRAFNKDSDAQLSSEEFPDFVRFCYAWRSQQQHEETATERERPASASRAVRSQNESVSVPCGVAHRLRRSASTGRSVLSPLPPGQPKLETIISASLLARSTSSWQEPPRALAAREASVCGWLRRAPEPSPSPCSTAASSRLSSPEPIPSSIVSKASLSRSKSPKPSLSRNRSPEPLASSHVRKGRSSASSRNHSPEPHPERSSKTMSRHASKELAVPPASGPAKAMARCSSNPAVRSDVRGPSKQAVAFRSNDSSRCPSADHSKLHREHLGIRQIRALKALLKDLALTSTSLPELVAVLLHNVMAPDSKQAFTKETIDHVCGLVQKGPSSELNYDRDSLTVFMQDLGHVATDSTGEEPHLVDQAIEVVVLLSLQWFAMNKHVSQSLSLPAMSDYQRRTWLPPAFSYLAGQVLWRHRTSDQLKNRHTSAVEHLRWIMQTPGVEEDMLDQCNIVFQALSSGASHMKLSQWRKVMELISVNPELRTRVRRCDAVRLCYGEALGLSESGLSRKNFKLMLMKTADLLGVHPVVLFKQLASHTEDLEALKKVQKESV